MRFELILCILTVITSIIAFITKFMGEKKVNNLRKEMEEFSEKDKIEEVKDQPQNNIFLNPDLTAYKILFNAKKDYLSNMINNKFKEGTITWNKYTELVEESTEIFENEIDAANNIWDLIVVRRSGDIPSIYEERIENINKILIEIEELMIKFLINEKKPNSENIESLLEKIHFSQEGVDMYVQE